MESYETQEEEVTLTTEEQEWLLLNEEEIKKARMVAEIDMMTEYEIIY